MVVELRLRFQVDEMVQLGAGDGPRCFGVVRTPPPPGRGDGAFLRGGATGYLVGWGDYYDTRSAFASRLTVGMLSIVDLDNSGWCGVCRIHDVES